MLKAEKPEGKISLLVHKLIPSKLQESQDKRLKSIVLLLTLLSNVLALSIFLPFIMFGFEDSPIIAEGGVVLIGVCMATYFFSFIVFYKFSSLIWAGNLALSAIFITAALSSWATGGITSPMMYLLFIPPVFSFILTNIRSGLFWTGLSAISLLFLWCIDEFLNEDFRLRMFLEEILGKYFDQGDLIARIVESEGYEMLEPLMITLNPGDLTFLDIIIPLLSLAMIVTIVAIYEAHSIRLNNLLSQERNLFAFKASHDALTGLANRAEFDLRLKMGIDSARHSNYSMALVYIDLDGFKPINDTIGHHAGDVVLENVSTRLSKIVRGTDTVARLGGDEFAILLQGISTETQINPILDKVLKTIAEDIRINETTVVNVRGSLGVAFYPEDADSPDSLCRHADMAMYLAKEQKNTWRFYKQTLHYQMELQNKHNTKA